MPCRSLGAEVAVLTAVGRNTAGLVVATIGCCRRLLLVIVLAVSGPVDTIAKGLTTAAKNWEGPQELVATKDLLPILLARNVIQTLVCISFHLKILNRGLVREGQFDVELEEHGHQDGNDAVQHVGYLDKQVRDQLLLVFLARAEVVGIEGPLDAFEPGEGHGDHDEVGDD